MITGAVILIIHTKIGGTKFVTGIPFSDTGPGFRLNSLEIRIIYED
jgi:hypothetical protein